MALENVMRVDNGHIIGGGSGGSEPYTDIEWSEWVSLPDEEKSTGNYYVHNAPDMDESLDISLMSKLWENPSPTASFAANTLVDLSSSDYDLLMVMYVFSTTVYNVMSSCIIQKGRAAGLSFGYTQTIYRQLNYVTDTQYKSGNGLNNGATDNNVCIPIVIYGIKLTASVKVSAIASDVSTSADKCMLSDGDSVEDRLDAHAIDNDFIDISSYIYNSGTYNDYTAPSDGYVVFKYAANSEGGMLVKTDTNNHITMATTKELMQSIFVKKGTQFCFGSTPSTGRFYSFV